MVIGWTEATEQGKEALLAALLEAHVGEWFNVDASYAAATAVPLMVKGALLQGKGGLPSMMPASPRM